MNSAEHELNLRKIFLFWIPLAATWLMMSTEGPLLAALIARLAEPKFNLAAHGVAFSLALIIEAPIIMIMSASTALVKDYPTYRKLRNFTAVLNLVITLAMLLLVWPPLFYWLTEQVMALPHPVAEKTHLGCMILMPWPGAIGFRRFYQGVLIRGNLTRRVAYGTTLRLTSMGGTAFLLYFLADVPGIVVSASAMSVGVVTEMLATRLMVHQSLQQLKRAPRDEQSGPPPGYRAIWNFYYPLALTPIIALAAQPLVTFFMGQSRAAIESLAVFPVVISLVFIFRSMGISYMEVAIKFMGSRFEGFRPLRNFAAILGGTNILLLLLIAATPLSTAWFETLSGLSPELSQFAILPTQLFVLMPGLSVLLSFQRAILVSAHNTKPITFATGLEIVTVIISLWITIFQLEMVGATAAVLSLMLGRIFANLYLLLPVQKHLSTRDGLAGELPQPN